MTRGGHRRDAGVRRFAGRDNFRTVSIAAQELLYGQLSEFAEPAFEGEGIDGYPQKFPDGTNIVAVIPGTDLADEYVVIGAHYDHQGSNCRTQRPGRPHLQRRDRQRGRCGGGAIAAARHETAAGPPRRTVVVALWDERRMGCSVRGTTRSTRSSPWKTVAYVNFDIQGSDLLPSMANSTIAVGAETGGPTFVDR